jgi:hypothetical protein
MYPVVLMCLLERLLMSLRESGHQDKRLCHKRRLVRPARRAHRLQLMRQPILETTLPASTFAVQHVPHKPGGFAYRSRPRNQSYRISLRWRRLTT